MFTHVEVEPNPSCPMSANQVFKNLGDPFAVAQVRIFEGEPGGRLCAVTGWSSAADGTPVAAYAVAVEDSSAGTAYIVYGGDWGIRLRSADATPQWRLEGRRPVGRDPPRPRRRRRPHRGRDPSLAPPTTTISSLPLSAGLV